jgi:hypothetical protein
VADADLAGPEVSTSLPTHRVAKQIITRADNLNCPAHTLNAKPVLSLRICVPCLID